MSTSLSGPDVPPGTLFTYNGMHFIPRPDCTYPYDYRDFVPHIGAEDERAWARFFLANDLWFFVFFVLKMTNANCPFVTQSCREVMEGPKSQTLDLWSREHLKSTILTTAEPIQKVINNPELRICIYSYAKGPAQAFLNQIKGVLETSALLKWAYPEIFYEDPQNESDWWGLDKGLVVKRKGVFKEATFEAHGLIEGLPTGKHFDHRINDDFVTAINAKNPEVQDKVKAVFMMSHYTGADGGTHRVVGTPYNDTDSISYIRNLKDAEGAPVYFIRCKPGREGGSYTGKSVFWSEERHREVMMDPSAYRSQVLLDPSPQGDTQLNPDFMREVEPHEVPKNLLKVMAVDPAGENRISTRQDSWAMLVVGFPRVMGEEGPELYILDLMIEVLKHADALDAVVEMYSRNGRIQKLGVEKVAMSSHEMHVSNALRARRKVVTVENGGLEVLRPAGRSKEERIIDNVQWPLNHGKVFISKAIPFAYRERLKAEMRRFPYWHDDGPDALAYAYEMAKNFRFGVYSSRENGEGEKVKDRYARKPVQTSLGWLGAG